MEPGEHRVGRVHLPKVISLSHEGKGFRGQAGLVVANFASWDVGFGCLEKDLSEGLLSLGRGGREGEITESFLGGGGEGGPVGFFVIGEAAGSGLGWGTGEPAVEANYYWEVVGIEGRHGIPPCTYGKVGAGHGDIGGGGGAIGWDSGRGVSVEELKLTVNARICDFCSSSYCPGI